MDFMKELNKPQQDAVKAIEGPLLVVAGAGSGKTRVITYRIANMLKKGIKPWNILAVTFTNKAAEEMRSRVTQLVPTVKVMNVRGAFWERDLWIGTFHATCVKILRKDIDRIGYKNNFVIYDASDQKTLVKECMRELNLSEKQFNPYQVQGIISTAKNKLMTPEEFEQLIGNYFEQTTAKIYSLYQQKLRENNALDFDDLLMQTVVLFRDHKEILEKYQERFKYIMVDEYQDTNHVQYHLINQLSRKHSNICVVGDPDQSIYRWRGADVKNILEFEDDHEDVKVVKLEQNYRSTKTILDSANHLIKNNSGRKHKDLWTDNDIGEQLIYYEGTSESEEIDFLIDKMEDEVRKNNKSYDEMVVFYRVHAQSRSIEEGMRRAGIPYSIIGGISFYERKEVKDILAYLRLIETPSDSLSLKRVINVPVRGIGSTTIERIDEYARANNKTFYESLLAIDQISTLSESARNKVIVFLNILDAIRSESSECAVPDIVQTVIDKTGYIEALSKEEKIQSQSRIENVKELASAAEEYAISTEEPSLNDFLEGITLLSNVDVWEDEDKKVTLMTLHCAKGLEFDVVFMVGMEEGLFPHANSFNDIEQMQEERRLCYVGMTRARQKLFITSVKNRMIYGKRNACIKSRFIDELPEGCLEKVSLYGNFDDEPFVEFRQKKPAESFEEYSKGQKVLHPKFGIGTILDVDGAGAQAKIRIMFDNNPSPKWLLARFAKLTPL